MHTDAKGRREEEASTVFQKNSQLTSSDLQLSSIVPLYMYRYLFNYNNSYYIYHCLWAQESVKVAITGEWGMGNVLYICIVNYLVHTLFRSLSHTLTLLRSLSLLAHDIGKIFICFHGFNDFSQSTKTQKLPNKFSPPPRRRRLSLPRFTFVHISHTWLHCALGIGQCMTHHNNLALLSPSLSLPPDSAVLDKPQDAALSLLLFFAWTMEPGAMVTMAINTGNRLVVYIYEENIETYSIIKKAYIINNTYIYRSRV